MNVMQKIKSGKHQWLPQNWLTLGLVACTTVSLMLACTDGGGSSGKGGCEGSCANAASFMTAADVQRVINQAEFEARARGLNATIAVSDRVGNVLAVYEMTGAPANTTITSGGGITGGLENIPVPTPLAAIAKAVTGAYLSSEGNAFSTRTASQIVQDHFNPGEFNQPGGPLFGVQISQLPCGDFVTTGDAVIAGPNNSPLGLSADAGGFPLYKGGTVVGGVGVIADGIYSLDKKITDGLDSDPDELVALAATVGFEAPEDRRGDRITVDGKLFRYSDADYDDLATNAGNAPPASAGAIIAVPGYNPGAIAPGKAFGQPTSGVIPAAAPFAAQDGFIVADDADANRFPPTAGSDTPPNGAAPLTAAEVETLLLEALKIANRARAQIRRPLGSQVRVSISVVDTDGNVLGIVRTRDAPIFGLDVSLQKARTAAFFSSAEAAGKLNALPDAVYPGGETIRFPDYVTALQNFVGDPNALTNGAFAFADRSGGNLSRPYYPDGIDGNPHGPLSKRDGKWSVFSTGLQLDANFNALANILFGGMTYTNCTGVTAAGAQSNPIPELANGLQIFPGSVPVYRGNDLVGGIGVSGDGIDQDDMISFLGLHNAGQILGTINNAPRAIRADQLSPQGTRLRYVNCPQKPFLNSDSQNVCENK